MIHPTISYLLAMEKQRQLSDERNLELRRHLREARVARRASHPTLWVRIVVSLAARGARPRRTEVTLLVRSRELPRRAGPRNDGIFDRRVRDRGVLARAS